jgi:uncharacterized membrane protein YuzA (DUF378 family)
MNTALYWTMVSCIVIMIIGSVNWLTTGIRNIQDDTETDNDLLSLIQIPPDVNNWIYISVGVASILFVLLFFGKQFMNKSKMPSITSFGF